MKIDKTDLPVDAASSGIGRTVWHAIGKSLAVVALSAASLTAIQAHAAGVNIGVNVGGPGYVGGPPPPPPRRWHRRHWHRPPPPPPRHWRHGPPPHRGPGWHP
ncbi:hypothetical protein [Robbsia sp. KACC 23696]|uniref:hypothetical protein n=1 Tax=Robbsia sp. KACC 23696 TaxID=3149231 RepID=UPI00325C2544